MAMEKEVQQTLFFPQKEQKKAIVFIDGNEKVAVQKDNKIYITKTVDRKKKYNAFEKDKLLCLSVWWGRKRFQ